MILSKNYEHDKVERKWYEQWLKEKYFQSFPNEKRPYTIVMPPPNITGVLHLGHALNMTVQDILIRRARSMGFNACWVPGCDHASIATEAKVVEMLKEEKQISKKEIGREKFLQYCHEWKNKYGGIIYEQLSLLGCSVDWDRASYTMDICYEQSVIKVFIDLFNRGLIYRGTKMINWDVEAQTALSDEEVEYRTIKSKLFYIKYYIEQDNKISNDFIIVATQRPETIMGDVALCAKPSDERYSKYKGCNFFIPLINKKIPIIFDDYVDKEFGTGILKITPAHDINDYNIGLKHKLDVVDILNLDGTISDKSDIYVGVERFEARKKIIQELKEKNYLLKEEDYETNIGFSQRTNTVVEPKISLQWFVTTESINKKALSAVLENDIKIYPEERFLNTYKHWLENPRDWCISRQLWWGHRIPVYYYLDNNFVVAENIEEAFEKIKKLEPSITINEIKQDEDCIDTWFSSWLWPIETFKGISNPSNKEFSYYYPTTTLVTGQDIIFFWVARMVMAGMELKNKKPFDFVYFTGMVRDKMGRKMSKSLGNSPDLISLIKEYGADAVRFGVMISSPAGNDLLFDESSLQQGKKFNNKLWNILKLFNLLRNKANMKHASKEEQFAIDWFENKLNKIKIEIEQLYNGYKLNEVLKVLYNLIWDDFCNNFMEWVKPSLEESISGFALNKIKHFFDELLQMLHPFMPFISEEIYNLIDERHQSLTIKQLSLVNKKVDDEILVQGELIKKISAAIREYKNKNKIPLNKKVEIHIEKQNEPLFDKIASLIVKNANLESITYEIKTNCNYDLVVLDNIQIFIANDNEQNNYDTKNLIDDLSHLTNFLKNVESKLSNEKFIKNAKREIIEIERKKKTDTIEKIKILNNILSKVQ